MKKVTILVTQKEAGVALQALRRLGVLHIKHIQEPVAKGIAVLERELANCNQALLALSQKHKGRRRSYCEHIPAYIREILSLARERQDCAHQINLIQKKIDIFKEWGRVSIASLRILQEAGIFVRLYVGKKRLIKSLAAEGVLHIVKEEKGKLYCALITSNPQPKEGLKEVQLPEEEFESLYAEQLKKARRLEAIDKRLAQLCELKECILAHKKDLLKNLEFNKVRFGMGQEEGFCYLQGFSPKDAVSRLGAVAERQGWGILIEEPDDPAEVPTLIRNPRWIEIIKPVFSFMGTVPGYTEYDISLCFLFFFSIFFAMLIGDAGYGFIFIALTYFIRRKLRTAPAAVFFLMYVLSTATIVWGAVTGTWFGAQGIAQLPILNAMVIERINSFIADNQSFLIYICFLIGAVHLSVAHLIVAWRFINSLVALSQIGWVCIIWTAFFIAGRLVLGRPLPPAVSVLGIVGALLVVLFSRPQKNVIKGVAISLADLPLKAINSFADVVSYLRLFAVGYATVAVAATFNNMAVGARIDNILAGFIAAMILFLGHSLNIILGLMAVIVHGVRLNMLEFSSHLNMQWSGIEYKPFRE